MTESPPKPAGSSRPPPLPSDVPAPLESNWDDDTTPRFELDDPMSESAFDRVTAIPDLPSEILAKQLMSEQPEPMPPSQEPAPRLGSEPPLVSVRAHEPMTGAAPPSFAPPPDTSSPLSTLPPPERPTQRAEPAGPELMELSDPLNTPRSAALARPAHDARDAVLELDLGDVARSGPPPAVRVSAQGRAERDAQVTEMKDRYAMGDFSGALVVAEGMLEVDADDLDAQRYAQTCRDVLTQMYTARLGALSQHVRVAVPGDQIRWLSLDHRAGFVLSLIDGSSTVEELLDISGMNRLDALRILYTLVDQRVIALD
jgi:hypothetical protein